MSLPGAVESTDQPATILEQLHRPVVTTPIPKPTFPAEVDVVHPTISSNSESVDDDQDCHEDDEKDLSDNISVATVVDQSIIDVADESGDEKQQQQQQQQQGNIVISEKEVDHEAATITKSLFDTEEVLNLELQQLPTIDDHRLEKVCHINDEVNENYSVNPNTNISDERLKNSEQLNLSAADSRSLIESAEDKLQQLQEKGAAIFDRNYREISPPPVPLVTYRWEEARRARVQVGYISSTPI